MKSIIATLAFATLAFGNPIWKDEFVNYDSLDHKAIFQSWRQDFDRKYSNAEEEVKKIFTIFKKFKIYM